MSDHDRSSQPGRAVRALVAVALLTLLTAGALLPAGPARADDPLDADAKLVLVLDASSSMLEDDAGGQTRIDAAHQALRTVIDGLQDDQQVGFRVFGATVAGLSTPGACTDSQLLVPIGTDNRDDLHSAVDQYVPYGETPIGYALQEAAGDLGSEGPRSILLVSDGESNCDPEPCEVARDIAAQGIDLTINVVGLNVDAQAREQLRCIADAGRGSYYDADDADSLVEVLDTLSDRAFRPFAIEGTPVEGAQGVQGAPVLEVGGQYTDEMGAAGEFRTYLVERTMPGSSIHVGVSARAASGTYGQFSLKVSTTGGEECATGYAQSLGGDGAWTLMSTSAIVWPERPDSACSTDMQLAISVETTDWGKEGAGTPYELVIEEEPPLAEGQELPEAMDDAPREWAMEIAADGSGGEVVGGSSFNDATAIEPGSYTADIVPGEIQFFRVPVGWGQELRVRWAIDRPGAAEADALFSQALLSRIFLFNPQRGEITDIYSEGDGASYNQVVFSDQASVSATAAAPVRWMNRDAFVTSAVPALAGEYYVAVAIDAHSKGTTFMLPYTLTVDVVGAAGEGAPEYAEVAPTEGASEEATEEVTEEASSARGGEGEEPAEGATGDAGASEGSRGMEPLTVGLLGAGGLALVGAGAYGIVRWRRLSSGS